MASSESHVNTSSKEDDSKRKNEGKDKKRNDKKRKQNHTWREEPLTTPHAGSFADADMRKRFGVARPEPPKEDGKRAKKKMALLLGYIGTNYCGFQINVGQRTIQAEIELALMKCNFLDARNWGFPSKYSWSTSGRTDKGVHAAAQVCSAKVELLPTQSADYVRQEMNKVLPSDICVLDAVRTSRKFCAKTQRDRVRYQYLIPSFLFKPEIRRLFASVGAVNEKGRSAGLLLTPEEKEKMQELLSDYRVAPDQLKTLRESLKSFEGTHSFHNYAKKVKSDEARATRYIVSFVVEDPVVVNGTEWIPTQVLGQSFLLNQIRKMVCMAIEVTRGVVPLETLQLALDKDATIGVGVAPAQGLYMDMSYYNNYNEKKGQDNPDVPDIDWHFPDSEANKRWKEFRNGTIMPHIVSEEERDGNFIKFLYLQEYFFDREYSYDPEKPSFMNNRNLADEDEGDSSE